MPRSHPRSLPGPPAARIRIRKLQRRHLQRLAPWGNAHVSFRARIVLLLERDSCVARVARGVATEPKTVRLWRDRYLADGVDGLKTRPRTGRRPRSTRSLAACSSAWPAARPPTQACSSAILGPPTRCMRPSTTSSGRSRGRLLSRTSVLRILKPGGPSTASHAPVAPQPRPEFRAKVTEICNVYLQPPPGASCCASTRRPACSTGAQASNAASEPVAMAAWTTSTSAAGLARCWPRSPALRAGFRSGAGTAYSG